VGVDDCVFVLAGSRSRAGSAKDGTESGTHHDDDCCCCCCGGGGGGDIAVAVAGAAVGVDKQTSTSVLLVVMAGAC
jgi:hypothetical protein